MNATYGAKIALPDSVVTVMYTTEVGTEIFSFNLKLIKKITVNCEFRLIAPVFADDCSYNLLKAQWTPPW